jgi:signal transduction histidine kinase
VTEVRPLILVVAGAADGRLALQSLLHQANFHPVLAESGAEAPRVVGKSRPDLVLFDIDFPELDGLEALRQLKADSALAEVPVIILSTFDSGEDELRAFAAGGAGYLRKPFQIDELRRRIESQIELARLRSCLASRTSELAESLAHRERIEKLRHELVHRAAHDMRSPIMAVSGYLELLDEGPIDEEAQREFIKRARDGTANLLRLVDAMSDLSRLEAGRMPVRIQRHELRSLAERAVPRLGVFAVRRIRIEVPRSLFVRCDEGLLVRVMANLLAEVLKASEEDEQVVVRFQPREDGWVQLLIEVVRSSSPQQARPPLVRTDIPGIDATSAVPWSGLGLAFCKLAMQVQGGRVGTLESSGSQGARFWLAVAASEDPLQSSGLGEE